jgi:hypothetical protein
MAGFTGEIEMKMSGAPMPTAMDVTYALSGDKVRFDIAPLRPGLPGVWGVEDRSAQKVYMVVDAAKSIMVTDLRAVQPPAGTGSGQAVHTGKLDTVAGHPCEIWVAAGQDKTIQMCVVKGLHALPTGSLGSAPSADFAWAGGADSGAMPLRVVVQKGSKEIMRFEAVKIDAKPIDPSRFDLPAGYKQVDQGALPGTGAAHP